MSLTVTIPIPPPECSPNGRHHWRVKAKAVRAYRATCGTLAIEAAQNAPWTNSRPRWTKATVQAAFYVKTRQGLRSDGDNRLASLKQAFDSLRDAGIIADDSGLTHLPITLAHDPKNPRVVLTITPAENAVNSGVAI